MRTVSASVIMSLSQSNKSVHEVINKRQFPMEAHSGQNYLIIFNVMSCLSNLKVFAVIFTLRTFNYIILHIINFMLCLHLFL